MTEAAPAPVPPSASEGDAAIDALILASAPADWCKVAMLIARTVDAAKAQSLEVPASVIVPRIYVLVEGGRLTVQGNVRRWRAAEIKLAS